MSDSDVNSIDYTVDTITSTLLERAQRRESAAWDRLVHIFGPLVYKWCRLKGLQPTDARDIGQEVFQAVYAKLDGFQRHRDQDTFRGWLRVVTNNKMRDAWRRQQRRNAHEERGHTEETCEQLPYQDLEDDDESRKQDTVEFFRRILDYGRKTISSDHWDVFWRVAIEEQSPVDVAEALGMKRSNIDKIKSRVLAKLREEFGAAGADD